MSILQKIRNSLNSGGFVNNVLTLMTGTAIAQAILVLSLPFLTRIYSPEQFGIYGAYSALVGLITIIVTAKYDLAIFLEKSDEDAAVLMTLAIGLALASAVVISLVVFISGNFFLKLFRLTNGAWIWLVPISACCNGVYNTLLSWNNRLRRYRQISINRIVQSLLIVIAQFALGLVWKNRDGLIYGSVAAYLLTAAWWARITWHQDRHFNFSIDWERIKSQAKAFAAVSRYSIAIDILSQILYQMPIFFLSYLFGAAASGYYSLTQRILGIPVTFISSSVGDVFRQKASSIYATQKTCETIFLKTFKSLSSMAIPLCIPILFFAPDLFALVFGESWREAGNYARVLLPVYALKFISHPLSYVLVITGNIKFEYDVHLLMLIVLGGGLFLVGKFFHGEYLFLGFYSAIYTLVYMLFLWKSHQFSKEGRD